MNKQPISVHTFGMANYLLKHEIPMKYMERNKFQKGEMVYYFDDTPLLKKLMNEYSKRK